MNLTRAAGRSMLASFFVVNGAKAAARPDALVADADPIARKVVPLVQQVAPPSVATRVPEDTRTLVRATGAAQVLGGLGLATGLGRRLSAGLLSASMVPHVLASRPARNATSEERTAARSVMLRNVALLGATLIASQDTQGKPSLGYRANKQAAALGKAAAKEKKELEKQAKQLTGNTPSKKLKKKAEKLERKAQRKADKFERKAQKKAAKLEKKGRNAADSLAGQIEGLLR